MTSDKNRLLMLWFIASEATFFIFLIIAYVYFRGLTHADARVLDPIKTAFFSIFLFSSSGTVWMAEKGLKSGRRSAFNAWLGATILLGAIFLAGQGAEYAHLIEHRVTVARNVFGTCFFTLTGFHGFHVFVGLVALSAILVLGLQGEFDTRPHDSAVGAIALYWHFVDVVWIFIFSIIYLGVYLP